MDYIVLMFIFAIHWISVLIDVILAYIMFPVFKIIPFVKAPRHLYCLTPQPTIRSAVFKYTSCAEL
jgi:hypothetical protein